MIGKANNVGTWCLAWLGTIGLAAASLAVAQETVQPDQPAAIVKMATAEIQQDIQLDVQASQPEITAQADAILQQIESQSEQSPSPEPQLSQPVVNSQSAAAVLADPDAIRILLSPEQDTTLVAQMVGRVAEVNASLGLAVTEDDLLVRFDCIESSARLAMAKAEHDAARQTLSVKSNLRRLDAAGDAEVAIAGAEARRAKAAVDLGEAQAGLCEIRAPFSGRVAKLYIKQHQGVNTGDPVIDLIGSGPLKIRINVPSAMLAQLQIGTPFAVSIYETGQQYPAQVTAINSRIDAVARTIEIEGRLADIYQELLPGMSGIARF